MTQARKTWVDKIGEEIGEAVEFVLDKFLGTGQPAPDNDDSKHVDQTPSVILPETSAYSEVRELSAYEKYGPTHPVNWPRSAREIERER